MGSGDHVVVFDVSSDEEVDTRVDRDYFDWLNEVMEAADEVEVISEVKGDTDSKYRKKNSSVQVVEDDEEEDDDDCVILDGDPDNTAKTAVGDDDGDKLAETDVNDNDDVVVLGQKGEIACRDFPHPRHSCAKYSFNSTSHGKYCDMCHCYVCDIPAPCPYWCIGVSTIDHCHANDKEKIWKNQREYFRTGNMPSSQQPSSKPTTPLPVSATVTHQVLQSPTQNIIRLSQNTMPLNQVGIRSCSSSSRVANLSNVRARYRSKPSVPVQSLSSVRNNIIQKERSSYMVNPRSRVASSRTRYDLTNNNNINARLYTNAQVSQSTHHSSTIVAPIVHPEMYTQQQLNCAAVTGSQSNVYTRDSDQNKNGSGNCQFQANADLFALPETPLTSSAGAQAQMVQQQPRTNENVLQTRLSVFESWLMENSNQTELISPLPEPLGQDYASPLTFDFETFLND